jgi:hypothetical protein
VIQLSATGSIVRIHVSYKQNTLNITVWVSHPWLGDGITDVDPYLRLNSLSVMDLKNEADIYDMPAEFREELASVPVTLEKLQSLGDSYSDTLAVETDDSTKSKGGLSRESLGLLLSCQLAELHGGQISIQGSLESGHRYLLTLPLQVPTTSEVSEI